MLAVGRVDGYDFVNDLATNELALDEQGNPIPSGLLTITLLEHNGNQKKKVPFVLPAASNSMYMGGMPEIGSMCIVGWKQQNAPVVIGFLPYGVANMVRTRRTIPNLAEGEVYLQSSNRTVDADDVENFFKGASIWLDRYGRVRVTGQDYELITGYLLSNEFTKNPTFLKDPVTGENVFLRERVSGSVERRIDDKGNEVQQCSGTAYIRANKVDVLSEATIIQTAKQGHRYADLNGNRLEIAANGVVRLSAPSGSLEFITQGSQTVLVAGNVQRTVMAALLESIGTDVSRSVGGNVLTEVGGSRDETVTGGDWIDKTSDGKREIIASEAIILQVTDDVGPIKFGSDSAGENFVMGQQWKNMMQKLLDGISAITVPTAWGPSGVPINNVTFKAIKATLNDQLSKIIFGEEGI